MGDEWRNPDDDEEDEEFLDDSNQYKTLKNSNIILIDCRKKMMGANDKGEKYFSICMKVASHMMKQQIISCDTDQTGIYLYGTRKKKNASGIDGVYELLSVDVPSAERIEMCQRYAADDFNFEREIGSLEDNEKSPLSDGLWACNLAFTEAKMKLEDAQRIYLFTNDDNPNERHPAERERAIQQARDAAELSRVILLCPLNRPGPDGRFDATRYFTRLLVVDAEEDEDAEEAALGMVMGAGGGSDDFAQLLNATRKKQMKKRRLATLRFVLRRGERGAAAGADGDGEGEGKAEDGPAPGEVSLAVALYALLLPAKKPTPLQLDGRENTPLTCETRWLCAETGQELREEQRRNYALYGGARVYLTKQEMAEIKSTGEGTGLLLLGFKPRSYLKPHHNLRAPYFLFPDDGSVAGSRVAFAALVGEMARRDVVALARFTPRANAAPKLVALLPQVEGEALDGSAQPVGLHVVVLPWADDIRNPQLDPQEEASEEQVQAAIALARGLNLPDFSPDTYENPFLQKFYATVEAIALGSDAVEWDPEQDDTTRPDAEGLARHAGLIEAFRESVGGAGGVEGGGEDGGNRGVKRGRGGAGEGGAAKRVKAEAEGAAEDWGELVRSGMLAKKKVDELKAYLSSRGKTVGGKKADLIERIEKLFK